MATLNRRPLTNRPLQNPTSRSASFPKRPRSPDPSVLRPSSKRVKAAAPSPSVQAARPSTKDRKQAERSEREQQKAEFKEKYSRAFPTFTFCFDIDHVGPVDALVSKIRQLGGTVDDFFSNSITHFITNRLVPYNAPVLSDKENNPRITSALKSPIKLKPRLGDDIDHGPGFDVLSKAVSYNKKIWSITKLESVLMRLIDPRFASAPAASKPSTISCPSVPVNSQRVLTRLLQSERVHGTLERDPSQKRHDFRYFSRASRFVLVEDMRQELATISAHEYPVAKGREGTAKPPWPVLHCHPCARGPFIAYDEREKKRWEKTQMGEADQRQERKERSNSIKQAESVKRRTERNVLSRKTGDLRRSASMNNLRRRATLPAAYTHDNGLIDLDGDGDFCASTNPSGFLASGVGGGYMAASGNSVGITSTTGTTSNAGYALRTVKLPASLSGRMKQEVVTSRKFPVAAAGKEDKVALMAPPTVVPEKQLMLKKSRSTNTLKLPQREEGSKPGYCESCRVKFDDFNNHITGRRHRKFAADDANFLQLDCILARVQRRTRQETEGLHRKMEERRQFYCGKLQSGVTLCSDEASFPALMGQIQQKIQTDDTEMTTWC